MHRTRLVMWLVAVCGALSLLAAPARADDVGFGIGYGRDRYGRESFRLSLDVRNRDRRYYDDCDYRYRDRYYDERYRDGRVIVVRPTNDYRYDRRYDRYDDRDCDRRSDYRYTDYRYRDRYDRDCDYRSRR